MERLRVVKQVDPTEAPSAGQDSTLDKETEGALLRLARFIHGDGQKKSPRKVPTKPSSQSQANPYANAFAALKHHEESGAMLNVYI